MRLLGRIFGSDKVLEGAVNGVTKGLDALVYTDEEKAGDAAKDRSEARGVIVDWFKNSQGQNIARRFLAVIITAVWLTMYLVATFLDVFSIWATDPIKIQDAAKIIGERAWEMNGAMMLILAFYFAAPHMGSIVEAALGRFGGKK